MANPLMLTDMTTIYVKPSMGGQLILRKPRTNQTSARVKAQQINFARRMQGNNIAGACRGRKGRSFYGCLRVQGTEVYQRAGRT